MDTNIDTLYNQFSTFNTEFYNAKCHNEMYHIFCKELGMFGEVVRNFFAGKEDKLKDIYGYIRNREYPYNKFKLIDTNLTRHTYSSYLEGMIEYVNKVIHLENNDTVDVDSVMNTLNAVLNKDNSFIQSLFNDDKYTEDECLDCAMKNIEVIIDIESDLCEFNKLCDGICHEINKSLVNKDNKYADAMKCCYRVLLNSISRYLYLEIKEIFTTYETIENGLVKRTPVGGNVVEPEYKLF